MWQLVLLGLLAADADGPVPPDPAAMARDLVAEVAETRGLPFEREVPVRVIDDGAARVHLLSRIHEFQSEDEMRRSERAYRRLGLLPQGYDVLDAFLDVMREQAAGYYDPATGAFYLLDDVPTTSARIVMVHELTHALEDQHFDLDGRLREVLDNDDRLLARSAIHEGSATLLMTLYLTKKLMAGEIGADALESFGGIERSGALGALPQVLQRQLVVPYVLGPAFLARGNLAAVATGAFPVTDVDGAYADPPESSEQILHPAKYWGPGERDEPLEVGLGTAGSVLGDGFELVATGVLGELGIGPLVGAPTPVDLADLRVMDGERWTNDAAAGWDGDRWELWGRGDTDVILLGSVWDTEADAVEFLDGLASNSRLRARRDGNRVAVVAGIKGRRADRALARILEAGAPAAEAELEPRGAGR